MTYTSHGHHIPDSPEETEPSLRKARCGGPGLCAVCSTETAKWAEDNLLQNALDAVKMTGLLGHKTIPQAARFQTKPVDVVAIQYEGGSDGADIERWIKANGKNATWNDHQPALREGDHTHPEILRSFFIETPLGWTEVKPQWWIIHTQSGFFTTCSPEEFPKTFQPKE